MVLTLAVPLVIAQPTKLPPAIDAIAPPSVTIPSLGTTLRVGGRNSPTGGQISSRSPGVFVERTSVIGPTLAEIVVHVLATAPPGPVRLGFGRLDGGVTSELDGVLLLYPRGAIGAPLSVNTATIVFPVEGTIVSNTDAVYPRALLGMSGSGTVVGAWAVDGAPFDRFVATTRPACGYEQRTNDGSGLRKGRSGLRRIA